MRNQIRQTNVNNTPIGHFVKVLQAGSNGANLEGIVLMEVFNCLNLKKFLRRCVRLLFKISQFFGKTKADHGSCYEMTFYYLRVSGGNFGFKRMYLTLEPSKM